MYNALEPTLRQYVSAVLELALSEEMFSQEFSNSVLRVDKKLGTILPSVDEISNPATGANQLTVAAARAKFPLLFAAFIDGVKLDQTLTDTSTVTFGPLRYFDAAEKLLSSLPVEDLQRYLVFQYVHNLVKLLSKQFAVANLELVSRIFGLQQRSGRDAFCVTRAITHLPRVVAQTVVQKAPASSALQFIGTLMRRLDSEMHGRLTTLDWLDDASRETTHAKIAKIVSAIEITATVECFARCADATA
ncbi:hypothetical protein ATCC90586_001562 [Pythium insidiosum]|nr:hypothetical protein ATCC90586_001562 [Pythium insidiosum]